MSSPTTSREPSLSKPLRNNGEQNMDTMPLWTAVPDRLLDLYRQGEKIQAIKEYRNLNHELCPGVQIKPTLRAAKSALEAADIFDGELPLVITEGSYKPLLRILRLSQKPSSSRS